MRTARAALVMLTSASMVLLTAASVTAQSQKSGSVVVPPGGKLRATLGEAKSEITVEDTAEPIAVTFGRMESSRFVAYPPAERLPYHLPFLVELRFAAEPPYDETTITLTTQTGRRHEVPAYKVAGRPTVFLTPELYFEDSSACAGLRFCRP
jgi:hypothetical protein